jgi:hypothetical protein
MRKKLSLLISSIALMVGMSGFALTPALVGAQANPPTNNAQTNAINCGVTGAFGEAAATDCGSGNTATTTVTNTIQLIIRILQVIVGVLSVVMIIFGGIKYITSGGDSGGVTSAKNTIIYACIGLAVVALSEVIVQFVLNQLDNV